MERVHFVPEQEVRDEAAALFDRVAAAVHAELPCAEVEHVGGTAVPGSITKGDVDIQVRVPPERFEEAAAVLAAHYRKNELSPRTSGFAAFEDSGSRPPLGIQLTAIGDELDVFWKFRDVLRANPAMRERLDDLKQQFEGGDMSEYRVAKQEFFEMLQQTREYRQLGSSSSGR